MGSKMEEGQGFCYVMKMTATPPPHSHAQGAQPQHCCSGGSDGGRSLHCGMLSSIPGLSRPNVRNPLPPGVTHKNVSRHRPLSLQGKTAPAESPIVVTQDQNGSSAVPMEQVCSAGSLPSVIINGAPALPMPLSPIHTLWRVEEGRPRWHTEGSVPQGQLSFMILWADTNAGLPTTILSDR